MGRPVEPMLPCNIEAEEGLLGSILIDPEVYVLVSDFLHAEDFYRDAHRSIYAAIVYLVEREETPDTITVANELNQRKVVLDPGRENLTYLMRFNGLVPTSGNAEYYAHIIERMAVKRRLIHAAGMIAASAQSDEADEALANAEECVFAISQKRTITTYVSISDVMSRCMERLNQVYEKRGSLIGIPTGFTDIDAMTEGLRRKGLYILAARPAIGKTSFATQIGYHAATNGYRVAIFSLEMGDEELGTRLISMASGVNGRRLQNGMVEDDEWDRVTEVMGTIAESKMVIDETGSLTIGQLRSRARQIRSRQGLDLIIVDYLQLLTSKRDGGKSHENRTQEVSEITRNLKMLAKELDVPVLALSQLSRVVEARQSKIPQLSDLRESGSIEQDADVVMFIYRDEVYNPETERKGLADIIVAKNRHGPTGEVTLFFEARRTAFANLIVTNPNQEGDNHG